MVRGMTQSTRRSLRPLLSTAIGLALTLSACGEQVSGNPLERAQAALAVGNAGAARVELMNAQRAAPNDAKVALLQAEANILLGDGVAAEVAARRAQLIKDSPAADELLAEARLLQGDPDQALDILATLSEGGKPSANVLRLQGDGEAMLGDFAAARALYERALAIAPKDERVLTSFGLSALAAGDLIKADELAAKLKAQGAKSHRAHLFAGWTALRRDRPKAALAAFDAALALQGDHAETIFARAMALGNLQRTDAMEAALTDGLKRHPDHAHGLYLMARLRADQGKMAEAQSLIERAGKGIDKDPVALAFAGQLALEQGFTSTAISRLKLASRLDPSVLHLRLLLAEALWRDGQTREAEMELAVFDRLPTLPAEVVKLRKQMAGG